MSDLFNQENKPSLCLPHNLITHLEIMENKRNHFKYTSWQFQSADEED